MLSRSLISPLALALMLAAPPGARAQAEDADVEVGQGPATQEEPNSVTTAGEAAPPAAAATDQASAASSPEADAEAQEAARIAEAIAAGKVLEQMSMEQVVEARGEPKRKEVIPPDAELWYYPGGEVAFSNGKVSYVSLAPREKGRASNRVPDSDAGMRAAPTPATAGALAQVPAPSTRVGDTYVYESRALGAAAREPGGVVQTRRTVTASGRTVTLSSLSLHSKRARPRTLEYTPEWNLLKSRNASGSGRDYAPPLQYFDFPLYPGKTWRQTTTETDVRSGAVREHTLTGSVGGWEQVSVPAGDFTAIRVELQTELYDPGSGERILGTDTSWYVPEVRRSVKSLMTGKEGLQRVIELISYRLGG